MMKIAVVGNADLTAKQRTEIDTFDHIVRFNNPPLSHRYDGKNFCKGQFLHKPCRLYFLIILLL